MSCTCNQSINCDPCAFCTPPGVTCLTTCAPIDPCAEKIDIDCVIYSGDDHPCSDIENGQPISQIMLQALSLIFPLNVCCYFEATVVLIDPPPSQYTFCYSSAINNGSCNKACSCDPTTSNVTVYSLDNPLVPGSLLYTNGTLSTLAPAGYYSANYNCITVSGGSISGVTGAVQSIASCIVTTTTAAPTTTLAPCYCYKVTMVSTGTILYTNCSGASITSPSYNSGTTQSICAQAITPNARYTVAAPTEYCADRITCPTTTTTTTLAPTTTTTTTIPCNCITFTNRSDQARISWRNCTGQIVTNTIAAAPDVTNGEYTIEQRCGSSGAANSDKIDIVVGAPCSGLARDAVCVSSSTTTTEACSPWLLYCCGNTGGGVISIKPCFPNVTGVPFAVNNMYRDEQLRNWIVVGSGGTPTSSYAPLTLMYVGTSTLANCQSASVGQLCPGITTTVAPPSARVMKFNATDCVTACASGSSVTVYSNCAILSISGCTLYTNSNLTTPVAAGYYVDTTTNLVFQVNSLGNLVSQFSCATAPCYTPPTTTPPSTTVNTKTITLRNNISYSPQLPANTNLPAIINIGFVLVPGSPLFPFIPVVSWPAGTFSSVLPNQQLIGTYTTFSSSSPFAIEISQTTTGSGYSGSYSARFYKNGTQVSCVTFQTSATPQTISSGQSYFVGDAIEVIIARTSC